ncbi:MAG: hypothetical protein EBW25_01715 [Actinobacteria bacterium]|nr:hypothetical protein [Actinomycetota bacterium]
MKKLALLGILLLNFLVLPHADAKQQVVIDRITQAEAEDLNIEIPDDVPPGHHSITIEVYDDKGTIRTKEIPFCKDNDGVVHWDDNCPDLTSAPTEDPDPVKAIKLGLQPYDPLTDSETTKGLHIGAFAALAALTSIKRDDKQNDEDAEQESLQSVSSGSLKLLKNEPGWGDLSKTWDNRFTDESDYSFVALAHRFNRFSPLLTRTVQDGNTIRAIIGSWAALLMPIGLLLGIIAAVNTGGQALPPAWGIVAAIMAVAIFDAFAGFVAGFVFFVSALLTGNITNRPEFLTSIGVMVLFFAPALLASAFRPFRRLVRTQDDLWERITDYALGSLLTFWVITKMVAAMNGLARLELPITQYGTELAWMSAVLLILRIALEDIAVEHYPMRLRALHVEIKKPSHKQKIRSLVFKIFVFFIMAAPFVGSLLNLVLGTILFAIPQITSLSLEDNLPKKKIYLPKGVFKTVVMIFVMALLSNLIEGAFSSPQAFLKWSFVVMALPGFFLHYLDAITDTPETNWKTTNNGRWIYRVGGVIIFILMVLVVKGVDIASWIS